MNMLMFILILILFLGVLFGANAYIERLKALEPESEDEPLSEA